jgi:riboflavin kinase/FMN adenylyltransferase
MSPTQLEDAAPRPLTGSPMLRLSGVVEHGDARARQLGFPTANIPLAANTEPADGVYAAWYELPGGGRCAAALNVGRRPTFYAGRGMRLAEAHLLDFEGDLYGQLANISIVARIRDEVRFDGVRELIAQLHADVADIRRLLTTST